jgi:hypothetical protein
MSQSPETTPAETMSSEPRTPAAQSAFRWLVSLEVVSLLYLMLPVSLFFVGWLRAVYAWPLLALVCVGFWFALRATFPAAREAGEASRTAKRQITALGIICLFLTICSGLGAFTFQFYDYRFNDSILRDLIQYETPLAYAEAGASRSPHVLAMYWGFWLVAGFAGKLLGWYAANYLHFLYSFGGLFLIALWFLRIVGTARMRYALLFLFFGGLDIAGRLLSEGGPAAANVGLWDYITGVFWWGEGRGWLDHWSSGFALTDPEVAPLMGGVFFRFYSPLSFLVDGPQHLIPGIIHDLWRRRSTDRVWFLWSPLSLCSPFVSAGVIPFLILGLIENRARNLLSIPNAIAPIIAAVFIAHMASVDSSGVELVQGFVWDYANLGETWWLLLLHYVVEFGLFALLIPVIRQPGNQPTVFWFLGALAFFVLAPFYRIGVFNDFASKVILPAQFVFILYIALAIRQSKTPLQVWRRNALIVLLVIGALGPLGMVARALEFGLFHHPLPMKSVRHMSDIEPRSLVSQAKCDTNAFFWTKLAKQPVYRQSEMIFPNIEWDFRQLDEPFEYFIFFEGEEKALTNKGLEIRTQGNRPILRRDEINIDTNTVGQIALDLDILVDGQPAKDAAIVVVWATPEQVEAADGKWPFQRWHSNQAYPVRALVSYNSYWRGTARDIAFYLRVPPGDERTYHVIIRKVLFLER